MSTSKSERSNGWEDLDESVDPLRDSTGYEQDPAVDIHSVPDTLKAETKLTYHNEFASDSLQQFLTEIGRWPLLTPYQEVELSQAMEKGISAQEEIDLYKSIAAEVNLNNQLMGELEAAVKAGRDAKDRMMNSNLRLVVSIAKKHRGFGLEFMELIQEGSIGLNRATEKFDWRRGYKFSTYATWWIKQAVRRSIANKAKAIRIPVHVGDRRLKLLAASKRLAQEYGREPTREELAEETGIRPAHIAEALEAATAEVSLNKHIDEDGSELGDLIEHDGPDPFEEAEAELSKQNIQKVLGQLSERERRVIELRFGLAGERQSLEMVGKELGLTRERIRQIENQTLKKLRASKSAKALAGAESEDDRQ